MCDKTHYSAADGAGTAQTVPGGAVAAQTVTGNIGADHTAVKRREFLSTNKLGGYSNLCIDGACTRTFAGYLVAAFRAPGNRAVIWEDLEERISFSDNVKEFFSEDKISYSEEGFVPSFTGKTDLLEFHRRLILDYDENQVKLRIDWNNNSSQSVELEYIPLITYRKPEEAVPVERLGFLKETVSEEDGVTIMLTPSYNLYSGEEHVILLNCKTLIGNGKCEIINTYRTGRHYPKDEATGFKGEGACYAPVKLSLSIPAGEKGSVELAAGAYVCSDHIARPEAPCNRKHECPELIKRFKYFVKDETLCEKARRRWEACLKKAKASEVSSFFENRNAKEIGELYRTLVTSADKFIVESHVTCKEPAGDKEYAGQQAQKVTSAIPKTIPAGYPWFLDWGRDTMISLTGLTLCTGRFEDARSILRTFAGLEKDGLLPNCFAKSTDEKTIYNTVDASLWFFYAADMYVRMSGDAVFFERELVPVLRRIFALYSRSREAMKAAERTGEKFCYGIYMDGQGLVHAGTDISDQLTWMDVRINGKAVTPRHGSPVEIQALWYNAVMVMLNRDTTEPERTKEYRRIAGLAESGAMKFYNPERRCLYDYLEDESGSSENICGTFAGAYLRPNQLWAVALPYTMFKEDIRREIVDSIGKELLVPLGIRSLARGEKGYIGEYRGDLISRDRAYHMGTAWGFLTGHYIIAYMRAYKFENKSESGFSNREQFEYLVNVLKPFCMHVKEGCIGGVAEVFDGDQPDGSRSDSKRFDGGQLKTNPEIALAEGKGCYSQAWSVATLIEAIYLIYSKS